MTLSGCAAFQKDEQFATQKRTLPPWPEYGKPVDVKHNKGDDELVIAARERAGRGIANRIIIRLKSHYDGVVRDYAVPVSNGR